MNLIDPNTPLDQFLLTAPEQRSLFGHLGVDFCHERNQSFAELCRRHALDWPTLGRLLTALQKTSPRPVAVLELMTLTELCDHVEHAQRFQLEEELTQLDQLTRTAAEQSGAEHPQLFRIRDAFVAFYGQFTIHLRDEAEEHFPLIRRLTTGKNGRLPTRSALKSRLARMEHEHNQADEALAALHALACDESSRLSVPSGVQVVADAIVRLEHTVHEQIYKENQVLLPRVLALGGVA
jgi:regulator of cell morphogenesis and NO signaling